MLKQSELTNSINMFLKQLLDINVYENYPTQDKNMPFCVFYVVSNNLNRISCYGESATIQINFFGKKKEGVQALRVYSDQINEDLNDTVLLIDSIDRSYYASISCNQKGVTQLGTDIVSIRTSFDLLIT